MEPKCVCLNFSYFLTGLPITYIMTTRLWTPVPYSTHFHEGCRSNVVFNNNNNNNKKATTTFTVQSILFMEILNCITILMKCTTEINNHHSSSLGRPFKYLPNSSCEKNQDQYGFPLLIKNMDLRNQYLKSETESTIDIMLMFKGLAV